MVFHWLLRVRDGRDGEVGLVGEVSESYKEEG
jgi:hypothetical protein